MYFVRKPSRLVVWVSLLAYLLANANIGLCVGSRAQTQSHDEKTAGSVDAHQHDDTDSDCLHCANHAAHAAVNATSTSSDEEQTTCTPDAATGLRGSCPCCPKEPCNSSCPCPGGCAMCNIAKTPCLSSEALIPLPNLRLGDSVIEIPFSYVPPVAHGLIRPPRN
jgi:hypothetical protein